ncbi:MAG: STAS domain-containing protein [Limnobacter sp.]|nr:STAS domain-containing protein [Limnobacter sp.]
MSETDQFETVRDAAVQDTSSTLVVQSLTIADCGPLYEQIKTGLEQGQKVSLDVSRCEDVDTAGLQLLSAIQNDPAVSLQVTWNKPSSAITEKATRLGLLSWIEAGVKEV